jgi:hypothetical protein
MKLYHITKNGTLHFQLKNGRLAAVYPESGYVRVAHSLDGFVEERFKVGMLNRFSKAIENKNPGNITMWPINKRIKTKTMMPVNMELFYTSPWTNQVYKYPNKVFYEMESSKCETFPNDIMKLMDLLTAFEAKNC